MKDVLDLINHLRGKSYFFAEEVGNSLTIRSYEIPAGVFGMIFNDHTILLELLSYYDRVWEKATTTLASSLEEAKEQNANRVILIQKMIFTQTLSEIEFCFKKYIKNNPKKLSKFKGTYLSKIMENSKDYNVTSETDHKLWNGTIELRNKLVHNNGIADKTFEYKFPNCKLIMEKDKMIRGDFNMFPYIIDWLLDATKFWLLEMDKK